MAKIAGTLSMAKTTSITSITTNATNSGVAVMWRFYKKLFMVDMI
jgi:hypothetical protein